MAAVEGAPDVVKWGPPRPPAMLAILITLGAVLVWAGGVLFVAGSSIGGFQGMWIMGVSLTVAGIGAAVAVLPPLYMRAVAAGRRPPPTRI